jgi:hypothetical protein
LVKLLNDYIVMNVISVIIVINDLNAPNVLNETNCIDEIRRNRYGRSNR